MNQKCEYVKVFPGRIEKQLLVQTSHVWVISLCMDPRCFCLLYSASLPKIKPTHFPSTHDQWTKARSLKMWANSEIRNAIVRHGPGRLSLREAWCVDTQWQEHRLPQPTPSWAVPTLALSLAPSLSLTLRLRHTRTHTLHVLSFNVCILIKYASKCMSIFDFLFIWHSLQGLPILMMTQLYYNELFDLLHNVSILFLLCRTDKTNHLISKIVSGL